MKLGRMLITVLLVALLSSVASAVTLVEYSVDGVIHTPPPEYVSATTVAPGLTALDLTRGPGIRAMSLTNGFSADGWHVSRTRDDALTVGAYFQLGFKLDDGVSASLSTLDFALRRSATHAPMNIEVQVSLDGFKTEGMVVATLNYFGRTSGSAPAVDPLANDPYYYMNHDLPGRPNAVDSVGDPIPTIDLTQVAALQNLPGGTEVTVRIYAWGNDRTTETNTLALGRMIGPSIGGTVTTLQ